MNAKRQETVDRLYGRTVVDPRGETIGTVKQVWLDDSSGTPMWVSVHTGLFGLKESFVPLQGAQPAAEDLRVPVTKQHVKDAPRIEAEGGHMSEAEQAELYHHYGLDGEPRQRRPDRRAPDESEAMTRSEERLRVGTEQVETGKVRLVKHVVTENQQVTVPVSHEEVHVVREPITDARRGGKIGEAEQEVTLHAEKPVVTTETVPVEQVRLAKDTVVEDQKIEGKVRKERIDVENNNRK